MRALAITISVMLLPLAGCYEETAPAPQAAQPQPQQPAPSDGQAGPGGQDMARPSQAGAMRAAQNTLELNEQHQRELEEAMKEP